MASPIISSRPIDNTDEPLTGKAVTRMTSTRDGSDTQLVINELLMYVFHHMKRYPADSIKTVLLDFYSAEAITEAKRKLWECYSSSLPSFERRTNKGLKNATEKEVDDIIKSVKLLDAIFADKTVPVMFVAINLDQVPDVKPGEVESISLLERVKRLEHQMTTICSAPTQTFADVVSSNRKATADRPTARATNADERNVSTPPALTVALPPVNCNATMEPTCDNEGFELPTYQRKVLRRQQNPKPKVVYGTKQSTQLRAGPRRHELFVFRVHKDIVDEDIKEFMCNEGVKVHELEIVSSPDAWTKSYRLAVEAMNLEAILQPDFWPDGIGCRRYWRKKTK